MIVNIVYQNTFAEPHKAITDESRRLEPTDPRSLARLPTRLSPAN